jgi:nitrogen regulatory protein PII-like uncharacterized protein
MKTEKAFEWLFSRFNSQNIKPCQFDLDCLVKIAEEFNKMNKQAFQENTIFAKLYVYSLKYELQFYKDIYFAKKKLYDVLGTPLELIAEDFTNSLNLFHYERFCKSKGIETDHLKILSKEEKAKQDVLVIENFSELQKYILGRFDKDSVIKSLEKSITEEIANHRLKN